MHLLARFLPNSSTGENLIAIKVFSRMSSVKDFFKNLKYLSNNKWPFLSGNYQVLNPKGQIAICTLTSEDLFLIGKASENVAIVGMLFTPNLGVERIIRNTISNPNIRHIVICGKDSPIFQAGQAIQCLFKFGVDSEKRIINAVGHFPALKNLTETMINQFLNQVELLDLKEELEITFIQQKIQQIEINMSPFKAKTSIDNEKYMFEEETFVELKAGGKRVPLNYDEKGFFVITTDNSKKEITVKHYYKDNKPGFIIKGHSSESILLAILDNNLVSQMSHAGYLGAELAKAETALKMNLKYMQDRSLKKSNKDHSLQKY